MSRGRRPCGPAVTNSQGRGPQDPKRPGGPPFAWDSVPYVALWARLPLFYPRPPLPCPRAAALTCGYCTSPHGCDNTMCAGVLLATLSGVRLPAGGHTLAGPSAPGLPSAAATLLWSRAALVLHQTSLVPCVWWWDPGAAPPAVWLVRLLAGCSATNSQGRDPRTPDLLRGFALCARGAKQPEVGTPAPRVPLLRPGTCMLA